MQLEAIPPPTSPKVQSAKSVKPQVESFSPARIKLTVLAIRITLQSTANPAVANTAETPHFCFLDICSRHTQAMGTTKRTRSVTVLMIAETINGGPGAIHFPGIQGSQYFRCG